MNCEQKTYCVVVGRTFRFNDVSELPEEIQQLFREEEELIRQQVERENRIMAALSEGLCNCYSLEDDSDLRKIENPPLWRKAEFSNYVGGVVRSDRAFSREPWRKPRANLWSGQRKRQVNGVEN